MEFDEPLGIWSHKNTRIPLTVWWDQDKENLVLLDQTKLPYETTIWTTIDWRKAAWEGIKGMVVRGSQAIGAAAGLGAFALTGGASGFLGEAGLSMFETGALGGLFGGAF